jgi:hypothetical protein
VGWVARERRQLTELKSSVLSGFGGGGKMGSVLWVMVICGVGFMIE